MITTLPFFTIYLGSPRDNPRLDESDRVRVIQQVTRRFERFTLTEGKGFFGGKFEDTLLIHVATDDLKQVAGLACELRQEFDQEGVGIEYAGTYFRATAETPVEEMTEALQARSKPDRPGKQAT